MGSQAYVCLGLGYAFAGRAVRVTLEGDAPSLVTAGPTGSCQVSGRFARLGPPRTASLSLAWLRAGGLALYESRGRALRGFRSAHLRGFASWLAPTLDERATRTEARGRRCGADCSGMSAERLHETRY